MEIDSSSRAKIWNLISQFVCWEFCRNVEKLFPSAKQTSDEETDLLTFFRDMVIEMTTKDHESDITKYEVLAKFLEELNMASKYEHFTFVVQFSLTLRKICPELEEITEDLITNLEEKFKCCVRDDAELIKDAEFSRLVSTYSSNACKLLPIPDLVEIWDGWSNKSHETEVVLSADSALQRLKKELVPEDIPHILDLIESGDVYKCCFKEERDEDGMVTLAPQDLAEFQQECSDLVRNYRGGSTASDCRSTCSNNSSCSDEDLDRNNAGFPIRKKTLLDYNYSFTKLNNCSVILFDVIGKYNLKKPYSAAYIESLPESRAVVSWNEEDLSNGEFSWSSNRRFQAVFARSKRKRSASSDSEGRIVRGCRRKRKFICSDCGKSYRHEFSFNTHKCEAASGRFTDKDSSSSKDEWHH